MVQQVESLNLNQGPIISGRQRTEGRDFSNPKIESILKMVFAENRDLAGLEVRELELGSDGYSENSPGFFQAPHDGSEKPFISISWLGNEQVEKIRGERSKSFELLAKRLGILETDITAEVLNAFVILHELGHAHDFFVNYYDNPDYRGKDGSLSQEAYDDWRQHGDYAINSLLIPGFSPGVLIDEIAKSGGFDFWLRQNQEFLDLLQKAGITTQSELIDRQEREYKDSAYEQFADDYATKMLKKYWVQRDIDKEKKLIN